MAVRPPGLWVRFWHEPLRAERLALTRVLLAAALLTQQLFEYLPNFADFFGPHGVAPAGLHDAVRLDQWHWTPAVFSTDDLRVLYPVFALWVAAAVGLLVGWHTRIMNCLAWFLAMTFVDRNPALSSGSDDVLKAALFLLLLSPSGLAFSLDARRLRRKGRLPPGPAFTPAWPVRVLQIQLCILYLTTGLAKLRTEGVNDPTWWRGTSIHYVLNYVIMTRWSYAQLPLPFWITRIMTYVSVGWEVLFTPLVLFRWTRKWVLWFGVAFHLGIWLTLEVGWFSFYTLSLYGVWVPCTFWRRWRPMTPPGK